MQHSFLFSYNGNKCLIVLQAILHSKSINRPQCLTLLVLQIKHYLLSLDLRHMKNGMNIIVLYENKICYYIKIGSINVNDVPFSIIATRQTLISEYKSNYINKKMRI